MLPIVLGFELMFHAFEGGALELVATAVACLLAVYALLAGWRSAFGVLDYSTDLLRRRKPPLADKPTRLAMVACVA